MPKRHADGPPDGAHGAHASSASSAVPARKRPRVVGVKTALPVADEAWRRKMMRAKEAVVLRAKTKKTYAKIKARALAEVPETGPETMHPDRQARLEDAEQPEEQPEQPTDRRRPYPQRADRRPSRAKTDTLLKAQQEAEQRQAEAEQRAAERTAKRAERVRMQKAMVRARRVEGGNGGGGGGGGGRGRGHPSGGSGDRRKLGRESTVLLDRVRKMMGK